MYNDIIGDATSISIIFSVVIYNINIIIFLIPYSYYSYSSQGIIRY